MRTTWLCTNTSMKWPWNLVQPGQTLWLLQVCRAFTVPLCQISFPTVWWQMFSILQHQGVQTSSLISQSRGEQLHRHNNDQGFFTFNALCKSFTWNCYFCSFFLPDQTPTPTRFLKNCEEVGLFNELASSFEQDDDDKRAKNSVRRTLFCMCVSVYSIYVFVYCYVQNTMDFFFFSHSEKLIFSSLFLTSNMFRKTQLLEIPALWPLPLFI